MLDTAHKELTVCYLQMVSQVAAAHAMYDTNGDGKLDLDEFVQMLTNKPWSALFGVNEGLLASRGTKDGAPPHALKISRGVDGVATAIESPVKSDHDTVASTYMSVMTVSYVYQVGNSRAANVRGTSYAAAAAAAQRAVELVFRKVSSASCGRSVLMMAQVDTDGNGFIDMDELQAAAAILIEELGEEPTGFTSEQLATQAFALFDNDHDGLIDLNEWKEMLSVQPWCQLLPVDARDALMAQKHGHFVKEAPDDAMTRVLNRIRVGAELGAAKRSLEVPVPEEVSNWSIACAWH